MVMSGDLVVLLAILVGLGSLATLLGLSYLVGDVQASGVFRNSSMLKLIVRVDITSYVQLFWYPGGHDEMGGM